MFYVSSVLIVAILSQSQNNYLVVHALEYHLIHAQFSSKAPWMETSAQVNPSGNINVKYRQASRIHFRQIATFADVRAEKNERSLQGMRCSRSGSSCREWSSRFSILRINRERMRRSHRRSLGYSIIIFSSE